jgi:hypothetical protein
MRYGKLVVFLASLLCLEGQTANNSKVSGPYTHENLSVFLIPGGAPALAQGAVRPSARRYVTLQQAMEQKKVVAHETNGEVVDLENTTGDAVFLQAGDMLKGGIQDRMITNDFTLPPHSGRVAVAVFCVEKERSGPRGSEPTGVFSGSPEMAAVRFDPPSRWSQESVWNTVYEIQQALVAQLRKPKTSAAVAGVAAMLAPASPTSLMLTQTSPVVEEAESGYIQALGRVEEGNPAAVGCAFAVNGKIKAVDLYANHELFVAMWPKLLKSTALEAVRRRTTEKTVAPDAAAVTALLNRLNSATEATTAVDGRAWVHRSMLSR